MSTTDEYEDAFDSLVSGEEPEQEVTGDETSEPAQEPQEPQSEPEHSEPGEESTDSDQDDDQQADVQAELDRLKKERDYYKHGFDANRGRVSAYQKKINELEAQKSAHPAPQENPGGSGMSDEQWQSFADEYPEMARAMEARLNQAASQFEQRVGQAVNARMSEIEHQVQPLKERAHEDFMQSQYAALDQRHPDWREVASSGQFREWIGKQPQAVQKLVESEDAQDASWLMDSYKAMSGASSPQPAQQRKQRLQQSVGVKSKGGGRATGIPDDFEAAFDYFASQSNS